MFRLTIAILCLLTSLSAAAQLVPNRTTHNFGSLQSNSDRVVDFELTNLSGKVIYLLHTEPRQDPEFEVKLSTKSIAPDSTAIVRIQYNPSRKGSFRKEIKLWHGGSMQPIVFRLSGDAEFKPKGQYTACPDFGRTNELDGLKYEWTVHVIDSLTEQPIPRAKVKVIRQGIPQGTLTTNRDGEATAVMTIGAHYLLVKAEGYPKREIGVWLHRGVRETWIRLYREPVEPILADREEVETEEMIEIPTLSETLDTDAGDGPVTDEVNEIVETVGDPAIGDDFEDADEDPEEVPDLTTTIEETYEPDGELDRRLYAANNVVFLIDISGSMNKNGKLDLVKISMIELLKQLRDIDRIAIVTYAGNASVKMESRGADQKEEIIEMIKNLEAKGGTQGGKGLKLAYQLASEDFIEGGNNQVIMATDGAFNEEDQNLAPLARRYAKKGIALSVVGVKNADWTLRSLEPMAKVGEGRYIHIGSLEDAEVKLLDEIKSGSLKQ